MKRRDILRILDANFNRSREGLRVCEEITRFVLEDVSLTRDLKKARHAITRCLQSMPVAQSSMILCRDSAADIGRQAQALENSRRNTLGLFLANAERAKESLRVLEETSKLLDKKMIGRFKKIRFNVYEIEKRTLPKLGALRHHRS